MPSDRDAVPQVPPLPYLPVDPNRITAGDVERMIETRISAFWMHQQEAAEATKASEKKKTLYKTVAVGVTGFVVGVGSVLIVNRFRRGNAGAAMTTARPNLAAVK